MLSGGTGPAAETAQEGVEQVADLADSEQVAADQRGRQDHSAGTDGERRAEQWSLRDGIPDGDPDQDGEQPGGQEEGTKRRRYAVSTPAKPRRPIRRRIRRKPIPAPAAYAID